MDIKQIESFFQNLEKTWKENFYAEASGVDNQALVTIFVLWEADLPGYMHTISKYGSLNQDELDALLILRPSYKTEIEGYLSSIAFKFSQFELFIYLSDRLIEVIHEYASKIGLR